MGNTDLVFELYELEAKIKGVFLVGHIVAIVIYCATRLAATYSSMIGQFVDIITGRQPYVFVV